LDKRKEGEGTTTAVRGKKREKKGKKGKKGGKSWTSRSPRTLPLISYSPYEGSRREWKSRGELKSFGKRVKKGGRMH